MAISMTEAAARQVQKAIANRPNTLGLRLGVKTTGCSGLAYVFEFADALNDDDQVFDDHGVRLVVDAKSLLYLDGTRLDFTREGLNEGFRFDNPNVKASCGCGESFTV